MIKKILFVSSRNILTTCGELRLIKNRAEVLFKDYGIVTDFIALQKKNRIASKNKEKIDSGGEVMTFPASYSNLFQMFKSFNSINCTIKQKLETGNYGMIIFSGIGFYSLSRKIKDVYNVPVIHDIHGANEDILEVASKSGMLKKLILKTIYFKETFLSKNQYLHADGALVVTNALENYLGKRYLIPQKFNFYTIPCATSSLSINTEEYFENRKVFRQKYSIADDEIVFIYSGGISPWQCVEETIDLYKKLQKSIKQKSRLLVFSFNIDSIKHLLDGINANIDSYTPGELTKALCAGDYAFLLRKDNLTNNVAFPNKFLEYVQSGMRIISSPYVYEIAEQIIKYQLGMLYDMSKDITKLVSYIDENEIVKRYDTKHIDEVLEYNSFKERVKKLADDVKKL